MNKFFTFSRIRTAFIVILLFLLVFSTVKYIGWGTVCAYCPVGILQVASSSLSVTIAMVVTLLVVIAITMFIGRAFCSWGCPTAIMRKLAGVKHSVSCKVSEKKEFTKLQKYSAYCVLAASIVGSFFVGFPLFCLICPIGLFFGFIFALHKLFISYQPGWELLIFPAIIILEIFLFKSWCSVICPIGAFFKLVNKYSIRIFKVKADKDRCKVLNGSVCKVCSHNCNENISVPADDEHKKLDCTLCLTCLDKCPTNAVEIKK